MPVGDSSKFFTLPEDYYLSKAEFQSSFTHTWRKIL